VVARLKEESDVPLRSHGSLSLNRALMAVLELIESRTLDGHTQELTYRPTPH
jgi:hypothetical protein